MIMMLVCGGLPYKGQNKTTLSAGVAAPVHSDSASLLRVPTRSPAGGACGASEDRRP